MKQKLINFINKQLTNLQKCVNINSNELRKDINMKKESLIVLSTTFAACLLSVIIAGLADNTNGLNTSWDIVQTPADDDLNDNVTVLPSDHLHNMSAGAGAAINDSVVLKPNKDDKEQVGKEDVETDNVGDSNDDDIEDTTMNENDNLEIETPNAPETPDINTSIKPDTPEDTTENLPTIDLSKVETSKGYYCVWGDFYLTKTEFDLICTTVHCETGSEKEPFESKQMVATVIFNQLIDDNPYDNFPDTIKGVVYYKNGGNFSVVKSPKFKKVLKTKGWTEEVELAVKTALAVNPYPRDLLYFRNKHYHKFGVPYKKSGGTYFSTRN